MEIPLKSGLMGACLFGLLPGVFSHAAEPGARGCARDFNAVGDAAGPPAFARPEWSSRENAYAHSRRLQRAFAIAKGDLQKMDPAALDFWKQSPFLGGDVEPLNVKSALTRIFERQFPGGRVILEEPGTAGMSGNPVFLIVNVNGQRRYAVKAYLNPTDLARELAGEQTVRNLNPRSFGVTELEGIFQFNTQGKRVPGLLMRIVPGEDSRVMLTRLAFSADPAAPREAEAAAARVARALGEVHRKTAHPIAPGAPGNDFKEYELKKIRSLAGQLLTRPEAAKGEWITPNEGEELTRKVEEAASRYERTGMPRAGFLHGDFHGGNSFPGQEKAVLVDWEKSTTAIRETAAGALAGNADPTVDVARFVESFASDFAGHPGGREKATLIERAFLGAYLKETGWAREEIAGDLEFHRLRYDLLQLGNGTKAPIAQQCATLDLALRRLGIRPAATPSPCPPR